MTILIDYLTLVLDSTVRQFLGVWEIKPDVAKRAVERGSFSLGVVFVVSKNM